MNWSYPYIQNLRKQGFLAKSVGGKKSYGCNDKATYATFSNIAGLIYFNSNLNIDVLGAELLSGPIDKSKLVKICNKVAHTNLGTFEELYTSGLLDYTTYTYIKSAKEIYNSHAYAFMSCIVDYLRKETPRVKLEDIIRCDTDK